MPPEPVKHGAAEAPPLTVLYDGACPLCRREIGVYRGLKPLQPDRPVCFTDVSDATVPLPPGTTREQLLAHFHVRSRNGELLSGARAFLALWAALLVAFSLLGMALGLVGLVVIAPWLAHASWHAYRDAVATPGSVHDTESQSR